MSVIRTGGELYELIKKNIYIYVSSHMIAEKHSYISVLLVVGTISL